MSLGLKAVQAYPPWLPSGFLVAEVIAVFVAVGDVRPGGALDADRDNLANWNSAFADT